MSEYRWVARKQKAIRGVVLGTSQATNRETFTNPIAGADFARLLIR